MDLTSYVDTLRHELSVAAAAAGEEARALAERLTGPLDSAARLVLLEALSAAADEITCELAPGSVEVRLRGREPSFVVTPPPNEESFQDADDVTHRQSTTSSTDLRSPLATTADATATDATHNDNDVATSRINLRLPDALKMRAEEAARQEGLSVNAWVVRAVGTALASGDGGHFRGRSSPGGQRYTGWVR